MDETFDELDEHLQRVAAFAAAVDENVQEWQARTREAITSFGQQLAAVTAPLAAIHTTAMGLAAEYNFAPVMQPLDISRMQPDRSIRRKRHRRLSWRKRK